MRGLGAVGHGGRSGGGEGVAGRGGSGSFFRAPNGVAPWLSNPWPYRGALMEPRSRITYLARLLVAVSASQEQPSESRSRMAVVMRILVWPASIFWSVRMLRQCGRQRRIQSCYPTPWLDEGRTYLDILPWLGAEAEACAEYENRPRCSVSRAWLRLGLKKLALQILAMPDDASEGITFDGQHLGFSLGGEVTLLPATGNPWAVVMCIPVQGLRRLPRRLMNDPVLVEVRPDGFLLDRTLGMTSVIDA